jgi:hypothetical protein
MWFSAKHYKPDAGWPPWVKNGSVRARAAGPFYPQEQTKPQTSSEKVKTFLPTSDALRAIAIEVLGYSNVGHLGSRHT